MGCRTREVKIVPESKYEPFKEGHYNTDEICMNYNLLTGYCTAGPYSSNKPIAVPTLRKTMQGELMLE